MKRAVSNEQYGAEFGKDSRGLEAPLFSDQSEARTSGTSDSSFNLDPASTIAGENSQASDLGLPSPEGKCESAMHVPDLIVLSVPRCSR